MTSDIERVTGSIGDLKLDGDAPANHGKKPLNSSCTPSVFLRDHIRTLTQSTNAVASQARLVKTLADDTSFDKVSIEDATSFHEDIKSLEKANTTLQSAINDLKERSIIMHLRSLGSVNDPDESELFRRFDKEIKDIVRQVLKDASDDDVLWKAAEACYNQVTTAYGKLSVLATPHPPKKPTNGGLVENDKKWLEFWISVINKSPGGPTLFFPSLSPQGDRWEFDPVPRYLFRTYDTKSASINNESIIAPTASQFGPSENRQSDLLTLEKSKAMNMLYRHSRNLRDSGDNSDNLMSWTSSLLFAIQYAIYKHNFNDDPSDIKICMIDTREFPRGQFAQDIQLLEFCKADAKRSPEAERFFDFRLTIDEFYNGECLSQGVLNHRGRSCVTSLEELIQNGLYELYPEFKEKGIRPQWTNRVKELREKWSNEQNTTIEELCWALNLATKCFPHFDSSDVVCVLLTLKNRKLSNAKTTSKALPEWARRPCEVGRSWTAMNAVEGMKPVSNIPRSLTSDTQHGVALRKVFE